MSQGELREYHFKTLLMGKPIFSWQRVRIPKAAMLVSAIKAPLAMVTPAVILMNAVQNSMIAVILECVPILKVALHVLVQTNISKEDIEEVVRKETAVKWMVEAIELVNVINHSRSQQSTLIS